MPTPALPSAARICYLIKQLPATVPPRLLREHREACRDALVKVLDIKRENIRVECQTRIDGDFQLTVYERGSRTSTVLMVHAARAIMPLHRDFWTDLSWSRFSLSEWSPGRDFDEDMRVLGDLQTGGAIGLDEKQRQWCFAEVAENMPQLHDFTELAAMNDAQLSRAVARSWQHRLEKL